MAYKSLILLVLFFINLTYAEDKIKVRLEEQAGNFEIICSGNKDFKAAVFLRGKRLWFVFDQAPQIDFSSLNMSRAKIIKDGNIVKSDPRATFAYLDLINPESYEITATKKDKIWIIKISPYDSSILASEVFTSRKNLKNFNNNQANFKIAVEGNQALRFKDPFLGDDLLIVPENQVLRQGKLDFVDFRVIESIIGFNLEVLSDGLKAQFEDKFLKITSDNYLSISKESSDSSRALKALDTRKEILNLKPFLVDKEDFNAVMENLRANNLRSLNFAAKGDEYFKTVLSFMANGWYQEAKGSLEFVKRYSNLIENYYQVRFIVACLYLLSGDRLEALDLLLSIDLNTIPIHQAQEIRFWQNLAFLLKSIENKTNLRDSKLDESLDIILDIMSEASSNFLSNYTNRIVNFTALESLKASFVLERSDAAKAFIRFLAKRNLTTKEKKSFYYLSGKALSDEEGLSYFNRCLEDRLDLYYYPRCKFERDKILYKKRKIPQEDYINSLQSLSVVWRGDNFEIDILEELARVYSSMNSIYNMIGVLKMIVAADPNNYQAFRAKTKASKAFLDYLKYNDESKLKKLGLFYSAQDLIPLGQEGDAIILQVAQYLIELDLVDQAIKLLDYQVKNRLLGILKEKSINELIKLYARNKSWQGAIKLVDETTNFPFNMTNPERKYLYLESLLQNQDYEDGIILLYGDKTKEADNMRSRFYYNLGDWNNFNDNSEPYLYSLRYNKAIKLKKDDYKKIFRQSLVYFKNDQMKLLEGLYKDLKDRINDKTEAERLKNFYRLALRVRDDERLDKDLIKLLDKLIA